MKKDKIVIYTDGAARGNPGSAGWGAIIINYELGITNYKIKELGGASKHATNNQMELTGPIEVLKYLKKTKVKIPLEIFSDSKYVILGITEWIFNWQKKGWRNAAKKPVLNKEFWEELLNFLSNSKLNGIMWKDTMETNIMKGRIKSPPILQTV